MNSRDREVVALCSCSTFAGSIANRKEWSCLGHLHLIIIFNDRFHQRKHAYFFSHSDLPEHFTYTCLSLPYLSRQARSENIALIFQDFPFILCFLHTKSTFLMCILSKLKKIILEYMYDQFSWSTVREIDNSFNILTCF